MHLLLILLHTLFSLTYLMNAVPIVNNRSRNISPQQSRPNCSTYNMRRRDLPLEDTTDTSVPIVFPSQKDSQLSATQTDNSTKTSEVVWDKFSDSNFIPRSRVLLPELNAEGMPSCLSMPDETFCEDVNNYPKVEIKSEIEYSPMQFLELFGNNNIDGRKSYSDEDLSEERVCPRIPRIIYPKMAKNQANQWIYVVNEVEYTQAVVAEICEKEGRSCAYLDNAVLPPGMSSRCRQKYSYKRLLALHPSEKRTYTDTFKFPSCCACYVKSSEVMERSLKFERYKKCT